MVERRQQLMVKGAGRLEKTLLAGVQEAPVAALGIFFNCG